MSVLLGIDGRFEYSMASFSPFISWPGGLFPGIIIYLSFFYPRQRLQIRYTCNQSRVIRSNVLPRIAAFYTASSLSGAFSGLLAAAIDQLDGKDGKPGWAWIFILVRCASTVS